MQQKCSPCTLKTFLNLPFTFKLKMCWATLWILTDEDELFLWYG